MWLFSWAGFNNTLKGGEIQSRVKWFDLFFDLLEEPWKQHPSVYFTFFLDCTECFCGDDTLPERVTES